MTDKQTEINYNTVYDFIENMPSEEDRYALLVEAIKISDLSTKTQKKLSRNLDKISINTIVNSEGYDPDNKWTKEMCIDGLVYIIKNKASLEETLTYLGEKYSRDTVWMSKHKHKKIYHQNQVVKQVEKDCPTEVKDMTTKGVYKPEYLTSPTTPNKQFKNACDIITLSDRIDALENGFIAISEAMKQDSLEQNRVMMEHQRVLEMLTLRLSLAEEGISTISDNVNVPVKGLSSKVKEMREEGKTIKEISYILGIKPRKVKYLLYTK